jgi:hypothetical protein
MRDLGPGDYRGSLGLRVVVVDLVLEVVELPSGVLGYDIDREAAVLTAGCDQLLRFVKVALGEAGLGLENVGPSSGADLEIELFRIALQKPSTSR